VAFFILCGYNHCVADMFYATLGTTHIRELEPLIYTTAGNLLGANVIPLIN
jgi:formate/nitrite transporter FocA (FNT family)